MGYKYNPFTGKLDISGPAGPQGYQGSQGAGGALGYYGSFYDMTDQALADPTQEQVVTIDTTAEANGVSIQNNSEITFGYDGTYSITFSAQLTNVSNSIEKVVMWLKKNGNDITDSATELDLNKEKSTGNPNRQVLTINYVLTLDANDYLEVYWSGTSTDLKIESLPANTTPTTPAIPSIILTATQVMYTQTGPQGDIGNQGSPGPQGVQGDTGVQGPQGAQGNIGNQGEAGAQGVQGNQGQIGSQGNQGAQGVQGLQGQTGSQGAQGSQGDTGPQGNVGSQGSQGNIGSQGAQGNQGQIGAQGSAGAQGNQGATGSQGATGPQGTQGTKGDNAGAKYTFNNTTNNADPSPGFFKYNSVTMSSVTRINISIYDSLINDLTNWIAAWDDSTSTIKGYLHIVQNDSTKYNLFEITGIVAKTNYYEVNVNYISGALPTGGSYNTIIFARTGNIGSQGAQGAAGAAGSQGPQGNQGSAGPQGNQGNQGLRGFQGFQGNQGNTGAQGNQGNQGLRGFQGFQGNTGSTGPQGTQGNQGVQGTQGNQGNQGNQGVGFTDGDKGDITVASGATALTIDTGAVTSNKLNLDYSYTVFGSSFTSATNTNWQDTGLDITLATAGTWLLLYNLRNNCLNVANSYVTIRLYNETTAAVVTDSERLGIFANSVGVLQSTFAMEIEVITTTANNVIRLEMKPNTANAYSLYSDTAGRSSVLAIRIKA